MNNNEMQLNMQPFNPNANQLLVKVFIGFVSGLIVSFLVFILMILFASLFKQALMVTISWWNWLFNSNPLLALIMLLIWFLVAFLGAMLLGVIYNFFLSDSYYDIWKIMTFSLLINWFLTLVFAILYIMFNWNMDYLLFILIFHISFSLFLTLLWYDMISNPNYGLLYLLAHWMAFMLILVLGFLGYKLFQKIFTSEWSITGLMMYFIVLVYIFYPMMVFFMEKMYYSLYENGSNALYTPSLSEMLVDEEVVDEVNVEIDN